VTDLDVRIETLKPMHVAWVRAFGRNPEEQAWQILIGWAKPEGLLDYPLAHPVFGFNNPPPSRELAEYGYELWIGVDPKTDPPHGIRLKDFPGGLYAVTSCPLADVSQRWKALLRWVHTSQYAWRREAHELERVRNPLAPVHELVLDLCLPIEG
jgi:DNA gyrase inhibitor GyrI